MYAVRCPNCRALLKLSREVRAAKLKCRACGSLFVGSSEVLDGAAPAPPPPPAIAPAAPRRPGPGVQVIRRYRAPKWPGIVAMVAAVGIIAAIGISVYLIGHKYYKEVDEKTGKVTFQAWLSHDEIAKRQEEAKQKQNQAAAERAAPTLTSATPAVRTPPEHTSLVGTGDLVEKETANDANIVVDGKVIDGGGYGILAGTVRNNHAVALESVKINIRLLDTEDKEHPASTVTCTNVPAGGSAGFSVNVDLVPDRTKRIANVRVFEVKKFDENTVCLDVAQGLQRSVEGNVLTLRGTAKNTTPYGIQGARIYCEYYDGSGILLGSADGQLTDGKDLPAGKSSPFEVRYEPVIIGNVASYAPRLIGKKAR